MANRSKPTHDPADTADPTASAGRSVGAGYRKRVLVRALWQTVNIGDVAHAPGTLRALERFAPGLDLALWLRNGDSREELMLRRYFPDVRIVRGNVSETGAPDTAELAEEFDRADFFLHGSGPHLVAERELASWREQTGKPYGVFGITVDPVTHPDWGTLSDLADKLASVPTGSMNERRRALLDDAEFVFCRDTLTLRYLRAQDIQTPVLEFGPDATFAYDRHDDTAAEQLMVQHGLVDKRFVCVIPRLRYTPYYRIRGTERTEEDERRDQLNEKYAAVELERLRDLVTDIVRQTDLSVLLCPEMSYEVELAHDEVYAKLADDARGSVTALPNYWPLEQAAAVYARAHSVVSMECHSPIMAVVAGTPTLYLRQPTDTIKGQMWADVGLADNIIELDGVRPGELTDVFMEIRSNYATAVATVESARERAFGLLRHMATTAASTVASTQVTSGS